MAKSTFAWIIEKCEDNRDVESASINNDILKIARTEGPDITVTASSLSSFSLRDIKEIVNKYDTDFILHTAKEPFIKGEVFDYLDSKEKTLGGFGDLFRVIRQQYNWPYLPPDAHFIMRGLKQHTRVSDVRRLDNKRYEISRHGLETVTIIALNDYDLGIESIRSAVDEFDTFDAVFKSNPNGSISVNAVELADSREIKVFKWSELLGKLNQEWNWKK